MKLWHYIRQFLELSSFLSSLHIHKAASSATTNIIMLPVKENVQCVPWSHKNKFFQWTLPLSASPPPFLFKNGIKLKTKLSVSDIEALRVATNWMLGNMWQKFDYHLEIHQGNKICTY